MDPNRQHHPGQQGYGMSGRGSFPPRYPPPYPPAPPQAHPSFQHQQAGAHQPQMLQPPHQPYRPPHQQIPMQHQPQPTQQTPLQRATQPAQQPLLQRPPQQQPQQLPVQRQPPHPYAQGSQRAHISGAQGAPQGSVPRPQMPSLSHIPRKHPPQPQQQPHAPPPRVSVKSEHPFVVKVKLSGVPLDRGIPCKRAKKVEAAEEDPRQATPRRSSSRAPKRSRRSYAVDLEDTDSDISDDEAPSPAKRIKKKKAQQDDAKAEEADELDGEAQLHVGGMAEVTDPNNVEAPPPGVLPSLWYSREGVLHVFVIEKILGWKTRPLVRLQFSSSSEARAREAGGRSSKAKHAGLDPEKAAKLSTAAITDNIADSRKRMEISRIDPSHCPVVIKVAAAKEELRAKRSGSSEPDFVARTSATEREEVLLIKWRGRSHIHCSWERRRDLEKFDPTNTAKGKIRRYVQGQEAALGRNWKALLDEGRSEVHKQIHPHGSHAKIEAEEDKNAPTEEEDFFPPDYMEVERILACDENEMDMKVFAKQRALNLQAETEALRQMEDNDATGAEGEVRSGRTDITTGPVLTRDTEQSDDAGWDPEDYVRYVVKWKGLQVADVTWEYWKDIKHDFVDQAEDFWHRQRPPNAEEVKMIMGKPHPHVRDFKKLSVSPLFGVSEIKRPIGDLGEGKSEGTQPNNDDDVEAPALHLRGYQLEGVNWLLWNWWNRRSCILADEMGLGKTIQSVCFLDQLHRLEATKVRGPFLVVAPLSLVNQWQSESLTWAPDMNVILYHGSADARDFLVKQEFFYSDQFVAKATAAKLKRQHVTKFHILITTYEVVLKDVAVLSRIKWKALIVDEAHRLKNAKSRLFEELAAVPREFCLLLTGTPLQNSTEELWALLHFADSVSFGCKDAFVEKFGQLTDAQQVSDLHSVLRPYLLRRVKEDVEKSLPPKEETILEVTLTPIQKTFYKAIYERNTAFLFKGAKPSNAPSLMNVMMELRKCCNHPFLIRGAEERILADAAAALNKTEGKVTDTGDGSAGNENLIVDWPMLTAEHLVKSSGKMVLLMKLLPKLYSGGHKVLIFSQMVRVLDLLEDLLRMKHYRYERLDGSKSASSRAAAVDRFNRKSCQRFVMLLSTRAGGLGLNLTSADTVIIFDSDWNPQNDLQAMARAHRIGQTRAVRVYRLLTAKTYEMHMFHSASMKLGLDRAVLAHQRQNTEEDESSKKKGKSKSEREMQAKEIDELLKKGAYDVFRDEDDKEAQQFMETDIDQLLEQSSRKVTYGSTANSSITSGLGSFSKASFVASTGDGDGKDVDLDDPDFWEKAVGLDAPPESTGDDEANLLFEKRSRKQVKVYDPYAEYAKAEKKKKDKVALKIKQEKEEKERIRLEKKLKKEEERRRKKRERDEQKSKESQKKQALIEKKIEKKEKPKKKLRKAERRRAARKAEREDPILERVKQAWEVPQRNRATAAALRFGFGRLCKIRHESNLTSLPIQDIEVFVRAYCYQLGIQAAVCLMEQLCDRNGETLGSHGGDIASILLRAAGNVYRFSECEFISRAIDAALRLQDEVQSRRRTLRIPLTLTEPAYVSELRSGGSLRALRRFAFLSRLNSLIEECLDSILADLGHEELGKRGCSIKDLSTLDVDLKARHVSTEELSHALGIRLRDHQSVGSSIVSSLAPWWDRSCDLALIVGTFIHGLGNYEAMRNDEELPFGRRIAQFTTTDPGSAQAFRNFKAASRAARKVFDDALSAAKSKAQAEAHEAVAAAVAASKLSKEKDPVPKESKKDASCSTDPSSPAVANASDGVVDKKNDNGANAAKSSEASSGKHSDDSDKITLHRLSDAVEEAIQFSVASCSTGRSASLPNHMGGTDISTADIPLHQCLPMPNSKCLDHMLSNLIDEIMVEDQGKALLDTPRPKEREEQNGLAQFTDMIKTTEIVAKRAYSICGRKGCVREDSFRGSMCGSHHRSLADGSDYDSAAASADLAAITSGADASRYQRGKFVPLLLTRYGLASLVYADRAVLKAVIHDQGSVGMSVDKKSPQNTESSSFAGSKPPQDTLSHLPLTKNSPSQENTKEDVPNKWSSGVSLHIPAQFMKSSQQRASMCAALLCYGLPVMSQKGSQHELQDSSLQGARTRKGLFSMSSLIMAAGTISGTSTDLTEESARIYLDRVLIPHCFRLCLSEPGQSSDRIKTSLHGDVKDSLCGRNERGRSGLKTSLPDPCILMQFHSEESIGNAFAILRRIRLSRAVQFVIGGGISLESLMTFLQSPFMRGGMDGLPIWWCPWIHDLALLVHAASYGLFAIIHDHKDQKKMRKIQSAFDRAAIERHIKSIFVKGKGNRRPALPKCFVSMSTSHQLEAWVKSQALQFPTATVIERRIALICAEMTKDVGALDKDGSDFSCKYRNIPMFDHGGWPINS